jgi:hypothetical protein
VEVDTGVSEQLTASVFRAYLRASNIIKYGICVIGSQKSTGVRGIN